MTNTKNVNNTTLYAVLVARTGEEDRTEKRYYPHDGTDARAEAMQFCEVQVGMGDVEDWFIASAEGKILARMGDGSVAMPVVRGNTIPAKVRAL